MTKFSGGCQCGQVRFEVHSAFEQFHLCHCSQCQRFTGTAHASNLFTNPNGIDWQLGAENVSRYDVPGRAISNAFCSACGSALPYVSVTGRALVVPAGSLDQAPPVQPGHHIFWRERAPWYDAVAQLPVCDGFAE